VLRVAISDTTGKAAVASVPIVPTCPPSPDGDLCLCVCQAGFSLGANCPADLSHGTPAMCPAVTSSDQ
jgi:hypothetical protein